MHTLDRREPRDAARLNPIEKLRRRARIGAAGVRVANVGGEEFKEAIGRALADGGDEGGGAVGDYGNELVHFFFFGFASPALAIASSNSFCNVATRLSTNVPCSMTVFRLSGFRTPNASRRF